MKPHVAMIFTTERQTVNTGVRTLICCIAQVLISFVHHPNSFILHLLTFYSFSVIDTFSMKRFRVKHINENTAFLLQITNI